eukprot:jgi/Picre1/32613/NNA_007959.t1
MADTRHQANAAGIALKIKKNFDSSGCEVTSVTQSSDVHVGGTKVKQSTIERMRRRERQKARQSAAISDAEREARREAQHQEWQARQERHGKKMNVDGKSERKRREESCQRQSIRQKIWRRKTRVGRKASGH